MSETQSTEKTTQETTPWANAKTSLTGTIIDLGLTWADMGIGLGKTALESTARALEATAKHLETFQGRLKTKGNAAPSPSDPAAPSA